MTQSSVASSAGAGVQGAPAGATIPPVPVGQLVKHAAADPKTTNLLLLVVVLCMSGMMPDQLATLCGV